MVTTVTDVELWVGCTAGAVVVETDFVAEKAKKVQCKIRHCSVYLFLKISDCANFKLPTEFANNFRFPYGYYN